MQDLKNEFSFTTKLNKLEKEELLTLPSPKYNGIINKCNHLGRIQMHHSDTKNQLPIHNILEKSDFAKIKTGTCLRVVQIGKPLLNNQKWVGL